MKKKLTVEDSNSLLRIFISAANTGGHRSKGIKIVADTLERVYAERNLEIIEILAHLVSKLSSLVTSKSITFQKNTSIIPIGLNRKQRNSIVALRLLNSVRYDGNRKIGIVDKLVHEIGLLSINKGSKSIALKNSQVRDAINNRANARYRW